MRYKKQCDRCNKDENWMEVDGGILEICFAENKLQSILGLKSWFHLCTNCLDELKDWMNLKK